MVDICSSWEQWFNSERWFQPLKQIENTAYQHQNVSIFPNRKDLYRAFELCPLDKVKVVIVGQDPYHVLNQANGLAFSVNQGLKIPPSLRNIFKEIKFNFPDVTLNHGDLTHWANQGVLLLNLILTVQENQPLSHQNIGWQNFTINTIELLNNQTEPLVFLLWGKTAQSMEVKISNPKHLVLKASHPSPLSASRGFLGCKHFYLTNEFLLLNKRKPIDWNIL